MKWLPAIAWLAAILYFSLTPKVDIPHPTFAGSDKLYHLLTYAIWQGLFFLPLKGRPSANLLTVFFLVNIIVGGLVEILQASMVVGRTGEFADFLFNVLGALLVYLMCLGR